MSTPEFSEVNDLISQTRYEEAKAILRASADPAAKQWLARLEMLYPVQRVGIDTNQRDREKRIKQYQDYIWSAKAGVVGGVIFLIITLLMLIFRDPNSHVVYVPVLLAWSTEVCGDLGLYIVLIVASIFILGRSVLNWTKYARMLEDERKHLNR